jgi:hypothetical protein
VTTAFKTLQDSIVTALKAAPAMVGTRVVAGRDRPLPEEHANDIAVSIESIRGADTTIGGAPQRWEVVYGVEIRARGSSTVDAVAAADPLLEKVYERLDDMPPAAGVNGWFVDPSIRIRVEEGSTPIASVLLALNVTLSTVAGSLTLST